MPLIIVPVCFNLSSFCLSICLKRILLPALRLCFNSFALCMFLLGKQYRAQTDNNNNSNENNKNATLY